MIDINKLRSVIARNAAEAQKEEQKKQQALNLKQAKRDDARKHLALAFVETIVPMTFEVSTLPEHDLHPPRDTSKYVEELLLEAGFKVYRPFGNELLTVSLPPESTESASSSEGGV